MAEEINDYSEGFEELEVIVMSDADDIPDYIIEEILEENPDAGEIIIYGYGELEEPTEEVSSGTPLQPKSYPTMWYGPVTTTKSNVKKDQVLAISLFSQLQKEKRLVLLVIFPCRLKVLYQVLYIIQRK